MVDGADGFFDGEAVGPSVGAGVSMGDFEGTGVVGLVGESDGWPVGEEVGRFEGAREGG